MSPFARSALAALCAVSVLVAPSPARGEKLAADVFKAFGGTYQSDCANAKSSKVTLFEDAIVYLAGKKRIAGANLQMQSSFFGNSPPEGYLTTFSAETSDGKGMDLSLWEDATGRYATVDGHPDLFDAKTAGKTKFRMCTTSKPKTEATKEAVRTDEASTSVGTAAEVTAADLPDDQVYAWDMVETRPKFKTAWLKVLGSRSKTEWLATLRGPGSQNTKVTVDGQEYLQVGSCKPHDCGDNNVIILWSEPRNALYAMVHEAGRSTHLGKPPANVAKQLGALWRKEFRSGQP